MGELAPKIEVKAANDELIIRHGEAPVIREPCQVVFTANIYCVIEWLTKKDIDLKNSRVIFNYDTGQITLVIDENNYYRHEICGQIETSKQLEKFAVNSDQTFGTFALAQKIRMNKHLFKDKDKVLELIGTLNKFDAQVEKTINDQKDDRGNYDFKRKQAVRANIPASITVCMPVIKGEDKVDFTIEFDIDPNNLGVKLVSPDLEEYIDNYTELKFKNIEARIKKDWSELAIIKL